MDGPGSKLLPSAITDGRFLPRRYALGVLERKGRLVRVYTAAGGLRYVPVDRHSGTNAKAEAMTVGEVVEWVRRVDDATLSLLRTEIEAEVIRRGVREPSSPADHQE